MYLHKIALVALTLPLAMVSTSDAAEPSMITIRGLNVSSSSVEVEALFGDCSPTEAYPNTLTCGGSLAPSYTMNETGEITHITFPCSLIRACEYSVKDLAANLSVALNLSPPVEVSEGVRNNLMMDGPKGDRLFVSQIGEELLVSISAHNFRKPGLLLD